ncbi:hypothetical protein [Pseudomonas phage pPA-3099-2aT.2]|uniref:Uncharacterized protein n=10 Tax=Viruses TaxID=10239 RepID=K4RI38_9CAUD|nr:hypothetical protein PaP1_gp101 [Pseudomonas phage PaP1]YP_007236929.1 hypothetical protein BN405_2-10_Ab1_orf_108 [Pseudomonas phage vB_PaeM_C2-10_Ab1]YP_010762494.1 hypothetical protein QE325_gp017 [Pseudomonas phage pPA-3099-2aT.2]YP_010765563.1 hypothetical protein QE349_gp070 [Pseudomonas phage vB_Paer_PsCh]KEH08686.1 hypothetical protein GY14_17390 [Delftia tsuruhatensis]KEH13017.1 hypothetical protein GY15_16820 [Delftia sp. 670]AEK21641.1 hypothetical protein PaP1_gp101 [Pseudomona
MSSYRRGAMTSLATYVIRHKKTKEIWTTPKGKRQWATKGAAALAWRNAYEGTTLGVWAAKRDMERWSDLNIPMIVENGCYRLASREAAAFKSQSAFEIIDIAESLKNENQLVLDLLKDVIGFEVPDSVGDGYVRLTIKTSTYDDIIKLLKETK